MDKSEGTDFFSKTFSSLTDTVIKWYRAGHKKVSLSSMKSARREKLAVLGNKVFLLLSNEKPVTKDLLKEEYKSIVRIDAQIAKAEEDLRTIQNAVNTKSAKTVKSSRRHPKSQAANADKGTAKAKTTKKTVKTSKSTVKKQSRPKKTKPQTVQRQTVPETTTNDGHGNKKNI